MSNKLDAATIQEVLARGEKKLRPCLCSPRLCENWGGGHCEVKQTAIYPKQGHCPNFVAKGETPAEVQGRIFRELQRSAVCVVGVE